MKKIIAIMLMLAMLICGCGRAENTTTEPTNATSISAESAKGTDSVTEAPTEPTEVPTEEVTEPSSKATEPSEPDEPDPYAKIKYYPFPLLDMTVGEIEAEYGEYVMAEYDFGYSYLYFPRIDLEVLCYTDEIVFSDERDQLKDKPISGFQIRTGSVYPGLTIGMTGETLPENVVWSKFSHTGADSNFSCMLLFANIDGYDYTAYFPAPFNLEETFHITDLPEGSYEKHREDYLKWGEEFMNNPTTELSGIVIRKTN